MLNLLAGKESREQEEGSWSSSRSREASMINATTSPTDSSDRRTQGHRGERWKGRRAVGQDTAAA